MLNLKFVFNSNLSLALSFRLVCLIHLSKLQLSHSFVPTENSVYTKADTRQFLDKTEQFSEDNDYVDQSRIFQKQS